MEKRVQGDVDKRAIVGVIPRQVLEVQEDGGVAADNFQHVAQLADGLVGSF